MDTNELISKRIASDSANKLSAQEALQKAGMDIILKKPYSEAVKHLTQSQQKKLESYAKREGETEENILRKMVSSMAKVKEVAEAIYTFTSRQSDGEKGFWNAFKETQQIQQHYLYDPNGSDVLKLPGGFLSSGWKGCNWKGLDFAAITFDIAELVAHKHTNGNGGSQTHSQQELMRLVQRASPCSSNPRDFDDPLDHRPEATEVFFRKSLNDFFDIKPKAIILAAIQDGIGREHENEAVREMGATSIYPGSPMLVFAGTREEYWMVRPMMFILIHGWDNFNEYQQKALTEHVELFHGTYPNGFHGFYGNPSAPGRVLDNMNVMDNTHTEYQHLIPEATTGIECHCLRCSKEHEAQREDIPSTGMVPSFNIPIEMTRMFVCNICGNKRCPHSDDHRYFCTHSNEPGQTGSRFGPPTQTLVHP